MLYSTIELRAFNVTDLTGDNFLNLLALLIQTLNFMKTAISEDNNAFKKIYTEDLSKVLREQSLKGFNLLKSSKIIEAYLFLNDLNVLCPDI